MEPGSARGPSLPAGRVSEPEAGPAAAASCQLREAEEPARLPACPPAREKNWYVLWTRNHLEDMVYDQLQAKGFHLFFPRMDIWMRRYGNRYRSTVPMFPGYLFLHHAMAKEAYLEVCKTRGLVKLLGDRWDQLAVVPDREIEAFQRLVRSGMPALPHPYLREGQRVRITHGLLAGMEGILRRINTSKGLFVISIDLLCRSVAVELDCSLLEAA